MSKKLIAAAAAAALALSALVVAPAAALGPFNVVDTQASTGSIAATNGSTGDLEHTILVPSQDVLRFDATNAGGTTTGTLLRYVVKTPVGGAAVSATAALGGAKLISSAQFTKLSDQTSASGTATLALTTDTNGDATFYAYTTSTADSTITVVSGASSKVLFLKGVSAKPNAYKLNFTAAPLNTAAGGKVTFTGTVTDMFGNTLKTIETADLVATGLGGNLTTISKGDFAQNSTTNVVTFTAVNRDSVGAAAISVAMHTSIAAAAGAPTKVTAFGDPIGTLFFAVTAVDLSAQITALTAQVAALSAQLANSRAVEDSVTKKKYNSLARKWNASNPSARVALKK